jgi:hypothetical protein
MSFEPAVLSAGEILPHQAKTVTALLYSNEWEDLEVQQTEPSTTGAKWTVEEAEPAEAAKLLAKSAKRIRIEIPSGLPPGPYKDTLRLTAARRNQPSETRIRELAIQGRVLRRLAIYGEVDPRSVVDMGKIVTGNGKRVCLTMKVRDEQLDLPVKKIGVTPEFLHVEVKRYETEQLGDGLYHLTIEVPATAPLCYHYSQEKFGKIHLEFDHPRIKELDLKVAFQVDPKW